MAGRDGKQSRRGLFIIFIYYFSISVSLQSEYSLTFTEEPESQVLTNGDTLLLTCSLSSSPLTLTNVKWFRGDDELDGSHPNTISLSGQTSTLSITGFGSGQSGEYWCIADYGSYGSLRSSSAIVGLAYTDPIQGFDSTDQSVVEYDPLVLQCPQPLSSPPASISWLVDGTTLSTDNRIGITLKGHLVISYTTVQDNSKRYSCQATNPKDSTITQMSESALVLVSTGQASYQTHQFVDVASGGTVSVVEGNTAEMECFTVASPISVITWYKDNTEVTSDGGKSFRQNKRILEISDVTSSQAGEYGCSSVQTGFPGQINSTVMLEVIVPPTITIGLTNQSALVESSITLSCEASGTPPLTWTWRHGSELVTEGVSSTGNRTELTVTNVQTVHANIYQCNVSHDTAGSTASAGVLLVEVVAPQIVNVTTNDIAVFAGFDINLICSATGGPRPNYNWYKNSILLTGDRVTLVGGNLRLVSVQTSDNGRYVCEANNTVDSVRSGPILIKVLDPLAVVRAPEPSVVVKVNRNTTLSCQLQTSPDLTISYKWQLSGDSLDTSPSSRFSLGIGSGDLTITKAVQSDSGVYTCTGIINVDGTTASSLEQVVGESTVVVATEPDMPSGVTSTSKTSTSVFLSWEAPGDDGGIPISTYWVEMFVNSVYGPAGGSMPDSGSLWRRVNESTSTRVYNVSDLFPYTEYRFRIIAENGAGMGPPSMPSQVVLTDEAAPTTSPWNLTGVKSSPTSVNISWQIPPIRLSNGQGRNGIVTSYRMSYELNNGLPAGTDLITDTTYLLEALDVNSVYEVRVKAVTGGGEGVYSAPLHVSTAQFNPDKPKNVALQVISNFSSNFGGILNISWEPPVISDSFSNFVHIVDYTVRIAVGPDTRQVVQSMGNSTSVKVSRLDWGIEYTVYVSGNFSTLSTLGPPASSTTTLQNGPPGPVTSIIATKVTDEDILLVWELPSDGGSTLTHVKLEGLRLNGSWVLIISLPSTAVKYMSSDVYSSGYTHYRIVACNSIGCSWGLDDAQVAIPTRDTVTFQPFYEAVWFIVVVAVVGVILVAMVIAIIAVCCKVCYNCCGRKDVYTLSDKASSMGSVFSVRPRPLYTIETREPEDHLFQNSTLDSRMASDSTPRLAHLEFGPPPAHAYSGSNVSSSTIPSIHSHLTLHTQSTHSLLQAKYSRAQHQWLNEGFSQDTPEHQRRREFIRGIDEMDNGSVIAESVASTYV